MPYVTSTKRIWMCLLYLRKKFGTSHRWHALVAHNHLHRRPGQLIDAPHLHDEPGFFQRGNEQIGRDQAMVILEPVASSFNGPASNAVLPVTNVKNVTITDCDVGTSKNTAQPWLLHNVQGLVLKNVVIAGKPVSTVLADKQPA